ncbi:MAG TPA: hypothetical protein VE399_11030 [Gemmatimonadales bacterium]|nr:hypothetical protein [Gemmatimonadales bacterium]
MTTRGNTLVIPVSLAIAVVLTLVLLAARVAAVPALSDPVSGTIPSSLTLSVPALYLVLAPLFTMWDGISMLSMTRLKGFLTGLVIFYLVWRLLHWMGVRRRGPGRGRWVTRWLREVGVLAASFILLLTFLVVGALWHRPMLSLTGATPGDRVVDFHSHTNASHDVAGTLMQDFDAEANLRWHSRAGFDAAFITDHNVVSGESRVRSRESGVGSRESRGATRETVLCPGIEVSAWRAHIVLLGDTLPVDRRRYNRSLESLLQLLETSERAYGSLSVASLPEYRRNHWTRLDTLIRAGLDGFEIVNASPKANELTRAERDTVIDLARAHNRSVLGVSDSHGWGATSMVWNLVSMPPTTPPAGVCGAVLDRLRNGFEAVRVVERHRLRPDSWWPMALTPLGMVWETWRSMGWPLTGSWVLWIWLLWGLAHRRR